MKKEQWRDHPRHIHPGPRSASTGSCRCSTEQNTLKPLLLLASEAFSLPISHHRHVEPTDDGIDSRVLAAAAESGLECGAGATAEVLLASLLWHHPRGRDRRRTSDEQARQRRWRADRAESFTRFRSARDDAHRAADAAAVLLYGGVA